MGRRQTLKKPDDCEIPKIHESTDTACSYSRGMTFNAVVQKHWLNALTAVLFAATIWRLGFSPELPAVLAFIFGGMLLAVIDWRIQRLPTRMIYLTLAALAGGLVFAAMSSKTGFHWPPRSRAPFCSSMPSHSSGS